MEDVYKRQSVASIIYMKSGKNDGSKTAYIYRDNELLRTVSLDDVKIGRAHV